MYEWEDVDDEHLDEAWLHASRSWRQRSINRLAALQREWDAYPEPNDSCVVAVAFDGDEAGQAAADKWVCEVLAVNDSHKRFLMGILRQMPYEQNIRSLDNQLLTEEYKTMQHYASFDWELAGAFKEWEEACLREIVRRSYTSTNREISFIKQFNADNTISQVLSFHGIHAMPGRTIRCPSHDDSSPSLKISDNDKRVFCFAAYCRLNGDGHGQDAWALDRILKEEVRYN